MQKKQIDFLKRILIYCAGLMSLAMGVAFSVNSNLGVSPVNSLPYVISLIRGGDMGKCVIMDCLVVAVGIGLSLVFAGKVEGIREGTVLCAILVGKVMKPFQKILQPKIHMFCFREEV